MKQNENFIYDSILCCSLSNKMSINQLVPFNNNQISFIQIFLAIKLLHRNSFFFNFSKYLILNKK
jgi:hypothetical protein